MAVAVAILFVLMSLTPTAVAGQRAGAFLDPVEVATVNLPEQAADGRAPQEQRRVCFEPGSYVLALYAGAGMPAIAGAETPDDTTPNDKTSTRVFIGSDHAQRWNWAPFSTAPDAGCHVLTVLGAGARLRVYQLEVGIVW